MSREVSGSMLSTVMNSLGDLRIAAISLAPEDLFMHQAL